MSAFDWRRLSIAVVGGDEREQEICRLAAETGASVRAYGFPVPESGIAGVQVAESPAEALAGAHYALFPVPRGVGGYLYSTGPSSPIRVDTDLFAPIRAGAHAFCGRVTPELEDASLGCPVVLHGYGEDRELMFQRAAAVVEGAVEMAIRATDVTIHGSAAAVIGFGTIGSVLTRRLLALGADVHVVARSPIQRAAAAALGAHPHEIETLPQLMPALGMVFSTVPARVVDRIALARLPRGGLVLDIVAPPDRSDLDAATELGHRAIWARGLGRRAPRTVGRSQWHGIRRRIERLESGDDGAV